MASEEVSFWSEHRTFNENIQELLSLDATYAPWNTERHDPAESLKLFGEGCAMPVTAIIDLPAHYDIQQESRTWWQIIQSTFSSTPEK
eukprot:CAMPEP_0179444028 /NCGR_PEP_ID=MMETSP0799-20121207/27498_1 /TAXON_ID=46947 /ORGANISM="Geminigera cryophila, Strain CCMP2564" /LENGTH=87 /DNA_ID=CAMNT_0021230709 /DNA_START=10 /DNA_END=273 /DNA_ORIENTATION=-